MVKEDNTIIIRDVLLSTPIYFDINASVLSEKEVAGIKFLADYIKENRDQRYTIYGYADCETGNTQYNHNLSERRYTAVWETLVRVYKVPASLLIAEGKGCNEENAYNATYNREVIVAAGRK